MGGGRPAEERGVLGGGGGCSQPDFPAVLCRGQAVVEGDHGGLAQMRTAALEPYLIALSIRLLIVRRRAAIGRQLIATPRALE